ncbi:SDR family NAD(P)-dependent oxidoreductase [Guptibacillus algicola]|uniref:SDR family NAD(P)-dependent oxidoreductase n=1 Tax=Guptibacillus algicola TaxID=225844 RepID=UPI001CD19CA4|nr:SDR family oxidoreductase [Alkalihalobacillus algicola]MCA0989508.1 SDR family oxidoreductase [Alkalihalobacillus algicola]
MENKTVMITGASKGLGKALAIALSKKGYQLSICARGKEELDNVHATLLENGADVLAVQADASEKDDIERFVSMTEERFNKIDVLINNASYLGSSPIPYLLDFNHEEYKEVMRVNAEGPFLMMKRVLPGMVQRGTGSVINVTSAAGATGYAGWGIYGVSKFALEGLTETWADELRSSGVSINIVDPGEMDTDMHALAVPDCDYHLASPSSVTDVFLYLADEASVTGQRLEAQAFTGGE